MQNKKLTIAGVVALLVVIVLVVLSYKKEINTINNYNQAATSISKNNPVGAYVAFLPATELSSLERTVILQLYPDSNHTATVASDYHNSQPPLVDTGTWEKTTDGFRITFVRKGGINLLDPEVLNFSVNPLQVTLINPDKVTWGAGGLVLSLSPLPLPSEWVWSHTTLKDGTTIDSQSDKPFSITFSGNGRAVVRGDCNAVTGFFGLRKNNNIIISALTSALYCEGSRQDVFAQDLARAVSYSIKGDTLSLTLPNKSGTMVLTRQSY